MSAPLSLLAIKQTLFSFKQQLGHTPTLAVILTIHTLSNLPVPLPVIIFLFYWENSLIEVSLIGQLLHNIFPLANQILPNGLPAENYDKKFKITVIVQVLVIQFGFTHDPQSFQNNSLNFQPG